MIAFGLFSTGDPPPVADTPPVEQVLRDIQAQYKQNPKKYEALVAKVDKAVRAALTSAPLPGVPVESGRKLVTHPYVALVGELANQARAVPAKTSAAAQALLARHPWSARLELVEGLEYGSDRPVPTHENGFVALGDMPELCEGPALEPNVYLWGLREIRSWRAGVQASKKGLAFSARGPKDKPGELETALPPLEALRMYLEGIPPEVPLLALPQFVHRVHARLAERRAADKTSARMDELLALLDARWNAFTYLSPHEKERTAVALPIFTLISDRKGFVYRFPEGERLGGTGDIPFVSDLTMQRYAEVMRGEHVEVHDFIADTPAAHAAKDAFWHDCAYLTRYRAVIELFARAVLVPLEPLPRSMDALDYPGRKLPESRDAARTLDVTRAHALLLWARAGRDPVALADCLADELFAIESNRFPKDAVLQAELSFLARRSEQDTVAAIAARAARERDASGAPSDFEREFSPHATYLDASTALDAGYLVDSFDAFHAPVRDAIRTAAYAVVLKELGR